MYKEKLNRIFAAAGAEMSDPTSELAPQFITLYLRAAVFLVMAMRQCGAPATDLEREVGVLATNTRSSLRNSWQVVLRIILESLAVPFDGSLQQIGQARLNPMSPLSMDSLREWLFQDSSDLLLQTHTDHDVEDEFFVELVRTLLRPRSMNSVKIVCPHTAKLTDRTMHAIATRLPTTKHLHMEFKTRREFTDESLKVLASHLPKELTSLHLDFVSNKHFTDEFSKELASHLPRELTSLYLGSHSYSIRRRLLRCGAWNDNRLV